MSKTLRQILDLGISILNQASIEESKIDAWYLFETAFSMNRATFLMDQKLPMQEILFEKYPVYMAMIKKRAEHMPLQQIIGTQEFMGLAFSINRHVLIPRQDTETLVEEVLKDNREDRISLLDLCTGSGCIAISLKKLGHYREVWATDISKEAVALAEKNSVNLKCQIQFFCGNMFEPCNGKRFDVIVSNPPYIPTDEIAGLMPEVREFEPVTALDGGKDGLSFYRRLAAESKAYLKESGKIYFEIGWNQGTEVLELLREQGFKKIKIIKDQAGLERVIKAVLP